METNQDAIEPGEDSAAAVSAPLRRCVSSRTERPQAELIRFVAGPDGSLVPDVARVLPGRGVWVTAERHAVETAIKTRAFSRSLKRAVTVAPDLAEVVDHLLLRRALDALSIANKAGSVTTGFSQVHKSLDSGQVAALLHGADAADDGRDKLDRKYRAAAKDNGAAARIVQTLTIAQLSLAMGRANVVHAALDPGGATFRFLIAAERLERYRSAPDSINRGAAPVNSLS